MDVFYTVVVIIAVIIMILALTYIGILISQKTIGANIVGYPPIATTCPDNWEAMETTAGNIVCKIPTTEMKNVGALYDTNNVLVTGITGDTTNNTSPTSGYGTQGDDKYIDFNDPLWSSTTEITTCAKKTWADTYNIQWDGVTNYTLC